MTMMTLGLGRPRAGRVLLITESSAAQPITLQLMEAGYEIVEAEEPHPASAKTLTMIAGSSGNRGSLVPHNRYAAPRIRDSYISFIPGPTERGTEPMYT